MATAKQIIYDARTIAGETSDADPTQQETIRIAEEALQKIGKLVQGIDPRVGGQILVHNFSTTANASVIISSAGAIYTPTTKTITGPAEDSFSHANLKVGGVIAGFVGAFEIQANFFACVVSKTNNTLVLDRDISVGFSNTAKAALLSGDATLHFIYISPASTGSPSLSITTFPINEIVMVTGALAGNMVPRALDEFLSVSGNPNFDNSGAFYQRSNAIDTVAGSGLTNGLGAVFIFYKRKPRTITALSDVVDLPIKYHGLLRDEIAKTLLVRRGKIPPPELADPLKPLIAQMQVNQKTLEAASQKRHVPNS